MLGFIIFLMLAGAAAVVVIIIVQKKNKYNTDSPLPKNDEDYDYYQYLEKTSTEIIELLNKSIDERLYQEPFDVDRYKEMLGAFIEIALLIPYNDRSYVNDGVLQIPEIDGRDGRFYRGIVKNLEGKLKRAKELFDSEKNERNKNNSEEGLSRIYPSDIECDNFVSNSEFNVIESKEYLTAFPPVRVFKLFADAQLAFTKKLEDEKKWNLERANGQIGYTTKFETYALLTKIIMYGVLQRFSEGNRNRVDLQFLSYRANVLSRNSNCEEFYNFEPFNDYVTNSYKALDWILTKNPDYILKVPVDFTELRFRFCLRDNDKNNYSHDMPFERVIEVEGYKELLSNPKILSNGDSEFNEQIKEFKNKWNEQFEEYDRKKREAKRQADEKYLAGRRELAINKIREDAKKFISAGGVNVYLVEYTFGYEDRFHRFKCFFSDSMEEVKQQFTKFFRNAYNGHDECDEVLRSDKHIIDNFIDEITCINYMFK